MKYKLSEKEIFPYRPKPFYFITTSDENELSYESMIERLTDLKNKGFGGIIYFNKPETGFNSEEYLSKKWFDAIKNTAEACKELGLHMWINEGFNFPPGGVGGRIEAIAPELKQRYITLVDGKPTVKEATWGFPAFEEPKSTELFIKLVYEEYEKNVGQYFGAPIKGFFSDADNRRVDHTASVFPDHPSANYFPWSSDFERTFKETYGYDIMPYISDIIARKNIDQAVDYWEHCGHIYQNWFKPHREWLNARGLKYTGHTGGTTPFSHKNAPRSSVFNEGRFHEVDENFDYPGTDQELFAVDGGKHFRMSKFITPQYVWGNVETCEKMPGYTDISEEMRPKQAASSAFIQGKDGAMCEMFAASNFGVSPQNLFQISAYQLMQGINFVVPHAYHHRFREDLKYFAPPDFSPCSMLDYSVKELNDSIAESCCILSKGEPIYPIALVDPTEAIWRNAYNDNEYLSTFHTLNHLPYGFTICSIDRILNKDYGFKVAIYAGIELDPNVIKAIEDKGIRVIGKKDIDQLGDIIDCDVKYEGEGSPIYTRRIIDGEEFTFFANVESVEPINGKISAYGRTENVRLFPGDICYISKSYDNIEIIPEDGEVIAELPQETPVTFDRKNIVCLDRFTCNGKTVSARDDTEDLTFEFNIVGSVTDAAVLIPQRVFHRINTVSCDGIELPTERTTVFDESYVKYTVPKLSEGSHAIKINKHGGFEYFDRILLEGDFDANITTDGTKHIKIKQIYNLMLFIPEKADVTLSPRRSALSTDKSWALQGQPFYSGGVTYNFKVSVPKFGEYRLVLPKVRDVVKINVNGTFAAKAVKAPYSIPMILNEGENELELTVYNSLANALECYLEESGILCGGKIIKIQ